MAKEIDSRVLEMEFDNKNFEKNVSTSLSTLDKLKKALNLDGATKGLNNVDTAANKLNFDKLVSAATALEKRFSVFGEIGAVAVQRVANAMMDLSTKTISFLTNGIVQGGIRRAMNLEQADFQLKGLLKDTEAVAAIMEDVNWSVDGTAYGLDAAAKAASMFAATGMRAGDEMKSALRGVAGVAAMTNSQYEDIANIFTTISGQGKVMADQYNQLASRGLNAAATIANYLTKVGDGAVVTEQQVREMTSEGKISFQTFAAAMDDAFGEHAKAANKTFTGAMSNIRAALSRIGADFVSPIIKQDGELVVLLNNIRLKINDIRKLTSPFAKETTAWLNDMLSKLGLFVKGLDFSESGYSVRIFKTNFEALMNIITALKQVLTAVGAGFRDAFPESISAGILKFSQVLRGLTERLIPTTKEFKNIRDISRAFFTILRDGGEIVIKVGSKAFGLLSDAAKKLNFSITDIPGAISRLILSFKELGDGANLFLIPVGAVANVAGTAKNKIVEWFNAFKELPQVQSAIAKFIEVMEPFVTLAKNLGIDAGKAIKDFIARVKELNGVSFDSTKTLFNNLRDIFSGGFKDLGEILKNFPKMLGDLRVAIGEQLSNIGSVFSTFWGYIKKGFNNVVGFFSDGRTIAGLVSAAFGVGLIKIIKDIKTNVLPLIEMVPKLVDAATGVLNQLKKSIKDLTTGIKFEKVSNGIYTIAKAIALLAGALVVLSQVPAEQLQNGGIALTLIAGAMAGLVAAFSKLDSGGKVDIKGIGATMIAMGVSMLLLVKSMKDIASMEGGVLKGLGVITVLVIEMAAVATILSKNQGVLEKGQKQMSSGFSMITFAFSIKTLVNTMKDISEMPLDKIAGSLIVLTVLMGEMVAMTKLTGKGGWQSGVGMLALAASIHLIISAIEKIGDMDLGKLVRAELVLVTLSAVLKLLSGALTSKGRKGGDPVKAGVGLLAAAGSILLLGYAIEKIGNLGVDTILKGLAVVTALGLVISGIIAATKLAGDNAHKVSLTLIAMSASIAILAGVITVLGSLDRSQVIQGTAAVLALMAMFALVIASTKLANDSKATLIIVTTAVTMLAAAIGILSFVEPDRLIAASTALSMVMAMFAVLVASTSLAKKAYSTIAVMALVVAELAAVLAALSLCNPAALLPASEALSLLMLSLSASFLIISKSGTVSTQAIAALALMGLVVAELAVILGVMQALNIAPSMETVAALSVLLIAMSGVLVLLSSMHVNVGGATQAALALSSFVGILGGVMIALGALMEYVPQLETFLDKGIEVLVKIGEGLGRFAGAIIQGFLDQIIGGLPKMADNLSSFMTKLQPFINGAKAIDIDVVDGVTHLAGAIIALSAAQVINGIKNLLPFVGSIEDFGKTLNGLGRAMVTYSSIVAGKIDPEAVTASATAAQALATLQSNLPRTGGMLQDFFGEKMNLDTFGSNLEKFGYSLVRYSSAITQRGGINADAITASANAAKALSELQNNLPSTGGMLQQFFGETMDLGTFGRNLETFGRMLVNYSKTITEGEGINTKAIEASARAAQLLADLQSSLPTVGGKLQEWFGGTMDIATFGSQIVLFGGALVSYCVSLGRNGGVKPDLIENSATAAMKLVELQNALPSENGWFQNFFGGGTMDIGEWGSKLVEFGNALSHYSAILAIGKGVDIDLIQNSVLAATMLISLSDLMKDKKGGAGALAEFGAKLKSFGYDYADATASITKTGHSKLSLAIEDLKGLVAIAGSMMLINGNSMSNFAKALKELGEKGIDEFVKTFGDAKDRVANAINDFMTNATEVIKQNQNKVTRSMNELVTASLDKVNTRKNDFRKTGSALLQEMITGFQDKKTALNNKIIEILDYGLKTINTPYMERYKTAGTNLMKQNISGINDQKAPFNTKMTEVLDSGIKTIKGKETEYKTAGSNVMSKFTSAIEASKNNARNAVTSVLTTVTTAINNKQKDFTNAGSTAMTNLSNGMNGKAGNVKNSAINAVTSAYNAIYGYGDRYGKFYYAGAHFVEGISDGIDMTVYKATAAARYMADAVDRAVRNSLKIKSPSRVAYETGTYYGEGFINSILDAVTKTYSAAKKMGQGASRGLNDAIDSAITMVSDRFNLTPVITPEVDPSNALATASQINSLFNGNRSLKIGSTISSAKSVENQNGNSETATASPAASYQFVQNNYSPKALSRIDIYRQTKNQFSRFKEVTVKG